MIHVGQGHGDPVLVETKISEKILWEPLQSRLFHPPNPLDTQSMLTHKFFNLSLHFLVIDPLKTPKIG